MRIPLFQSSPVLFRTFLCRSRLQSPPKCQPVVPGTQVRRGCHVHAQKQTPVGESCGYVQQSNRQIATSSKVPGVAALLTLLRPLPSLAEQHNGVLAIADLDPQSAGRIAGVLSPILSLAIFLMICRIPLSWYPNLDRKKLPWVISVAPTEPVLGPTRKAIPPVGGVDIAPIIWVALLSFVNEILLGPQGILNMLQRKADL